MKIELSESLLKELELSLALGTTDKILSVIRENTSIKNKEQKAMSINDIHEKLLGEENERRTT